MITSQLRVTLAGALILSSVPASAQDQSTLVPIAGVWSLGETRSCDSGPAWVFFADGYYAEVQLPDGAPAAKFRRWPRRRRNLARRGRCHRLHPRAHAI